MNKTSKIILLPAAVILGVFSIVWGIDIFKSAKNGEASYMDIPPSGISLDSNFPVETATSAPEIAAPKKEPDSNTVPLKLQGSPNFNLERKIEFPNPPKEVSLRSFEEIINSSVIQLYCGDANSERTGFSNISRGTGIVINEKGEILTNRHLIYDEVRQRAKKICFVLKSPFPNAESQNPKVYYEAEITDYPAKERYSKNFSEDKYFNDFAILKISARIAPDSKIGSILGFNLASSGDYHVLENGISPSGATIFNYLPIDWNYRPKNDDILITLGYGVDASRTARQITSVVGKLSGNIDVKGDLTPQIILMESSATAGFSGGAVVNLETKGLVGLVSWMTSGSELGKYTVAIFRDFLEEMMVQDINFDLKSS